MVQLYLDPGNIGCRERLPDLLGDIDRQLGQDNPGVTLIRRLDAGYDSLDNRHLLAALPGYFIMKGARSERAVRPPLVGRPMAVRVFMRLYSRRGYNVVANGLQP